MGHYFLFRSGGLSLAVPLELVREVVSPTRLAAARETTSGAGRRRIHLGDDNLPLFSLGSETDRGIHEALAVVEEKGLTAGIFIDKIEKVMEESMVKRHRLPGLVSSFCTGFEGLLEVDDGLYLLVNVAQAIEEVTREEI